MPVNLYPNGTEEELLAMAEAIQRFLTTGEITFVTLPGGGQMQRQMSQRDAKTRLMEVLYALHKINPNDYENPYAQRVRVTRPHYVNA